MWSNLRTHVSAAASAGLVGGIVVGVIEAAKAAGADRHLVGGADFWAAWAITVGIYATVGVIAFAALGMAVGLVTGALRRPAPPPIHVLYSIMTAMAVPPALLPGRADLDLPAAALAFALLPTVGLSIGAGAAVGVGIRLLRGRLALDGAAVTALLAGFLAGGALWARWSGAGPTGIARAVPVAAGAVLAFGLYGLWPGWRMGGPGRGAAFRWLTVGVPVVLLGALALTVPGLAFPAAPHGAPNVLLITVDALRADRLGAYGNRAELTPNLDAFARDAVVFENAYASAPWTGASMGSMWTSAYPSELGLVPRDRRERQARFEGGLLTPQPTLAEMMRAAGYTTAAELVNPQIRRDRGFDRGFIRFRNPDDFAGAKARVLPRLGRYENWFVHTSLGLLLADALYEEPRYYRAAGVKREDARRLVHDAWTWLDRQEARPFLLWMHLMDTHVPYDPPHKSAATRAAFPQPPFEPTPQFYKDLVWQSITLGDRETRYLQALYDDEVRHADRWIGWLLDNLRRGGLYDDTLIIVSADHGEEFWEHGGYEHGHSLNDEVLHVPLLVKFPHGQYAGRRTPSQVGLIDLLPTVLEVAGLNTPRGMRGRSLASQARAGQDAPGDRELFMEATLYGEELKALRTARYKVIFHAQSHDIEVYDLHADPGEHHNLASDPQAAAGERRRLMKLARASAQRTAWWTKFGQQAPPLDERSLERLRSIGYTAQ